MNKISRISLAVMAAIHFNVQAQEQSMELDTITVSSAREISPLNKLANNAAVINDKALQENMNVSVQEALSNVAGVSFDGTGRYGLSDVRIRGISGNRVKILVDGEEINSQFNFGPFQNAGRQYMDLNNIKQVEVIKGPASSLHGSDAIGGVVSLVSKSPENYLKKGQTMGGNINTQFSGKDKSLNIDGGIAFAANENFSGLISFSAGKGDEVQNHSGKDIAGALRTRPDPQEFKSKSLNTQLRFKDGNNTLTLAGSAYRYVRDTNVLSALGPSTMNIYRYDKYLGHDTQKRNSLSLRHDFKFANPAFDYGHWKIYHQTQKSNQQTTIDGLFNRAKAPVKRFRDSNYEVSDSGLNIQLHKNIEAAGMAHQIVYGLDFASKNFKMNRNTADTMMGRTKAALEKNAPNSKVKQLGIFAQDRIFIGDGAFSLIPGLRYDFYELKTHPDQDFWKTVGKNYQIRNYKESNLSLRLGGLYDFSESQSAYFNYAEGFRAPAFNETNLGFENQSQGYAYVANPNLQPEKSRSFEIGYRVDNGALQSELSAFYSRYKNFIATQTPIGRNPQSGLMQFSSVNLPSAQIYGLEYKAKLDLGELAQNLQGLSFDFSAAWAKGKNRQTGRAIESVAPLSAYLALNYEQNNWGTSLKWRLAKGKSDNDVDTSAFRGPREITQPAKGTSGYGVVDLSAYYKYSDGLRFNAGIFNIFDKKYITWSEASALADTISRERYSAPGRWFGVSVNYEF